MKGFKDSKTKKNQYVILEQTVVDFYKGHGKAKKDDTNTLFNLNDHLNSDFPIPKEVEGWNRYKGKRTCCQWIDDDSFAKLTEGMVIGGHISYSKYSKPFNEKYDKPFVTKTGEKIYYLSQWTPEYKEDKDYRNEEKPTIDVDLVEAQEILEFA